MHGVVLLLMLATSSMIAGCRREQQEPETREVRAEQPAKRPLEGCGIITAERPSAIGEVGEAGWQEESDRASSILAAVYHPLDSEAKAVQLFGRPISRLVRPEENIHTGEIDSVIEVEHREISATYLLLIGQDRENPYLLLQLSVRTSIIEVPYGLTVGTPLDSVLTLMGRPERCTSNAVEELHLHYEVGPDMPTELVVIVRRGRVVATAWTMPLD
jgi:hypothetical protein